MKSRVTLLLICMLFTKALSLTCQCLPSAFGNCTNERITCKDKCLSATTSVNSSANGVTDYIIKTCGMPELCANVSLNLGTMNVTFNAKCCSTDLCNAENLPVLPKQDPNGRTCYTCDAHNCSAKVRCEGDEDRCVAVSVHQGNETMSFKGCMSKSLCTASGPSIVPGISVSKVKCCEGNLCNGAESFTLSFLLMIIPLLSSVFFY